MTIPPDVAAIIFVAIVLSLVIAVFIAITVRVRRGGGSLTTVGLGATHEFLNKDRRKAAETIVNLNAGKELESQTSGASKNPILNRKPDQPVASGSRSRR